VFLYIFLSFSIIFSPQV